VQVGRRGTDAPWGLHPIPGMARDYYTHKVNEPDTPFGYADPGREKTRPETPATSAERITYPTVLVAEDDPADELLLRRAIQKAALELHVECVHDGFGAVEYLQSSRPSRFPVLLLLDLRMPGMDGFGVLDWLQSHPERRPAFVVVLSSCSDGPDLQRACARGVDHYLVKPADPAEFAAMVKRLEPYFGSQGKAVRADSTAEGGSTLEQAA
jgi:CheY-like chemotaxis protein